jgi:hypothetical protein
MTTTQNIQELAAIERERYIEWRELLAVARTTGMDHDVLMARRMHRAFLAIRKTRDRMGLTRLPWHTEEQRQKYEARLETLNARNRLKQVEVTIDRPLFRLVMGRDYDPVRDRVPVGSVRSVGRVIAELRARGELDFLVPKRGVMSAP